MKLSIKDMFRASWAVFKKNPWPFVGATALIVAISFVVNMFDKNGDDVTRFVVGIVGTVLTWWLYIGFLRMALSASAGGTAHFADVFSGQWPMLLQFAIMAILTGIIVAIGTVLLLVPGLIAQTGLIFGALFVVDKGMKGIDSMKASWNLTKGHKWEIFWALIVLGLFNLAGLIVVGIGLLVTVPTTAFAFVHLYKELEKSVAATPAPQPAPQK